MSLPMSDWVPFVLSLMLNQVSFHCRVTFTCPLELVNELVIYDVLSVIDGANPGSIFTLIFSSLHNLHSGEEQVWKTVQQALEVLYCDKCKGEERKETEMAF